MAEVPCGRSELVIEKPLGRPAASSGMWLAERRCIDRGWVISDDEELVRGDFGCAPLAVTVAMISFGPLLRRHARRTGVPFFERKAST
jgi:hypothetical protein